MPTQPSPWYSGPLSPQQLNLAMYSFDGSGYGATGILFHSHRLIMAESMTACRIVSVSTGGTWNVFQGIHDHRVQHHRQRHPVRARRRIPRHLRRLPFRAAGSRRERGTAAPAHRDRRELPRRPLRYRHRSRGDPRRGRCGHVRPGWHRAHPCSARRVSIQAQSTQHTAQSFYLDLVNTGTNNNTWQPAGFYADASLTIETPASSSTDTAGNVPRNLWVWASVTDGGSTVSSVPTPQQSWTGPVTSSLMNGPAAPCRLSPC